MGGEPREKGVSYSGEVMVVATAEHMALFDEQHLNGDQQMGGSDPNAIVYYPGGYATRDELRKMQEPGDGMWRLAGGARRRSRRRGGRRVTKKRQRQLQKRRVSRR